MPASFSSRTNIMIIYCIIITILFLLLSFLYLRLRSDVRTGERQIEYIQKEKSAMKLSLPDSLPALRHIVEMVEEQRDEVMQMRREQQRKDQEMKEMISCISHDIRTPLTSAAGYLQMLEDCGDRDTQRRYISIVRSRLDELKEMLEELFLYTKLTNEEFVIECSPTPAFPVLCDCMVGLYHVFDEKGVEPEIRFSDESLLVSASPESLGRIFRNLINNALLHGAGGLCVVQKGDKIIFSNPVEDPSALDPEQLFERFYKADSSRKKGSSGLGLAIVSELMHRMGGTAKAKIHGNCLEIVLTFSLADKNF